jgi:hypothetical protein
MQSILPFLGESVIRPHPFQQALPSQIRQIGPSCAWGVAKMLHQIPRVHSPFVLDQAEGLMLIRLHFRTPPKDTASFGLLCRKTAEAHIREFAYTAHPQSVGPFAQKGLALRHNGAGRNRPPPPKPFLRSNGPYRISRVGSCERTF